MGFDFLRRHMYEQGISFSTLLLLPYAAMMVVHSSAGRAPGVYEVFLQVKGFMEKRLTPLVRGRLAPSPTGFLHLGNAWAFLAAWLGAKTRGGDCILRLEDIDPARSTADFAAAIIEDLTWFGLSWEYGPGARQGLEDAGGFSPCSGPFVQSERLDVYAKALDDLRAEGLLYPCYCTRKELRAIAGAPHVEDAGAPYPNLCRTLSLDDRKRHEAAGRRPSWRLLCPASTVWTFDDAVMGTQARTLEECGGDFALYRSDGVYAYQLAVVVDDIAMGVTEVVRGNDILCSTPRQMYLYSLFGASVPRYAHVPLVLDCEGERLAKRHQAMTLRALRGEGVFPETLVGWLALSSGLLDEYRPMAVQECLRVFSFAKIRRQPFRLPPDPVRYFLSLQ